MIESHGELSLRGAKIGVSLSLRGSRLRNPYGRRALNAPQLTVERTALPDRRRRRRQRPASTGGATPARGTRMQRFECQGGIRLDDGRFGDAVDLEQARFVLDRRAGAVAAPHPDPRAALHRRAPGARQGRAVRREGRHPGRQVDELAGSRRPPRWAASCTRTSSRTAASRSPGGWTGWLAATPEYSPGAVRAARAPCCATAARTPTPARCCSPSSAAAARRCRSPAKLWGYAQDWTVAYGYRPGRAAVWMAVLWAVGAVAFSRYDRPAIKPGEHPDWNPALYALDLLVPVINLGPGRLLAAGGRLAVGGGGPDPARLDPGDDGGGGGHTAAAAGLESGQDPADRRGTVDADG